jgi:hypothetical protein
MNAKYTRQVRPHPDTIANSAAVSAADIAAKKQVKLPAQEEVQQTEVMQTPQGVVAETVNEEILPPSIFSDKKEVVEDGQAEVVEQSPLTMKDISAADLIKKYS